MGHFNQRSKSRQGVFRRRHIPGAQAGASRNNAQVGPWGGIFWENLCTEFDHTRTAQEITDGKLWASDWNQSVEGVFRGAAPGAAYTPAEVTSRQPLWDDASDFEVEVDNEDWTAANTLRLAILAWTP